MVVGGRCWELQRTCLKLLILPFAVAMFAAGASAQGVDPSLGGLWNFTGPSTLDAPCTPEIPQSNQPGKSAPERDQKPSTPKAEASETPPANQEPPRILHVMPNFRAVSAGVIPPPPTPREAFVVATENTFDYSSFLFVGITSLLAEGTNAHSQLGKGIPGFGRYYWRGFVDKADGNYLVIFALPTILHEDERYFAMGKGSFLKRLVYSATRVVITPNYQGQPTFNAAELLGRGISQGVSLAYYPSKTQTFGGFASKFGYAVGRDALTNVVREFWPDIAVHVLHRHP